MCIRDRPGKALYSAMLNETGGVVDDLIVYFIGEGQYRVVINAGTAEKDPVSYTHLDVYKRQRQTRWNGSANR